MWFAGSQSWTDGGMRYVWSREQGRKRWLIHDCIIMALQLEVLCKTFISDRLPEEIRKIIYTTNAVESLNSTMRKIIKTRGSFPSEEAALKLLYLAILNLTAKWETIQGWKAAMNRFQIQAEERIQAALGA